MLRALLLCLFGSAAALCAQPGEYALTVRPGARQTFRAFGSSQVSTEFGHFPPEPFRSQMADLVYRGLRASVLRLWVASGPEKDAAAMKAAFYADYVDNGVLPLLQARGVTTLLLGPARGMEAPSDAIPAYAAKLAQFIREIRDERGVAIAVTGIANEPEGWSGEQLAQAVKCLRAELDRRGLKAVEIIAPESPSANEICDRQLDALHADSEAWKHLAGISTHSYNMAAREETARRAHGKAYWMTEAADDGNEQGEDEERAATIAGRFLNDLNHGVTHWIFFKGFSYSPDVRRDGYTASRITQYDAATGKIVTHLKYFYLKQLTAAFNPGAAVRRCESATEADMVYTYGQKPRVCAAAAVNPDGSWAVGVVNLTGIAARSHIEKWHPAEPLTVRVQIEEWSGTGERKLALVCSRAGRHAEPGGEIVAQDGVFTVAVAPREALTLRSAPAK